MIGRPRRDHNHAFEVEKALAAIKGDKSPLAEAQQSGASEKQITERRRQLLECAPNVLGDADGVALTPTADGARPPDRRRLRHMVLASIVSIAVLGSTLSFGQDLGDAACPNTETQLQLDECLSTQVANADTALGAVYAKLLDALDPVRKVQARAAERAWVSYKTEMCKLVGLSREGGSMQGAVVAQCLVDMAHEQTAKLQWQLACGASGELLPRQGEVCNF